MAAIRTWNENITTVQMTTQLCREKSSGMWEASVEVKHSTQAQDGQKQSQKHQSSIHQLPGVLLLLGNRTTAADRNKW